MELPHIALGLTEISVVEAAVILGRELPDTTATTLGPPQAIYRMPEGGVLLAWRDDTATLWIRTSSSTDAELVFRKLIGASDTVESVDGIGTEAVIIVDPHVLQTPQRRLAAQQVLLWHDDRHEYRLEADRSPTDLVAIARDLG